MAQFENDRFYSEQELAGRGFAAAELAAALRAGHIEGTASGGYRGGSITDWIQAGCPGGAAASTISGDPIAQWEAAVSAEMARGKSKARAMSSVVAKNPELHAAYLEAYNAEHANARQHQSRR